MSVKFIANIHSSVQDKSTDVGLMQRTVRILLDDFSWLVNTSGAGRPQTKLPLNARLLLI